MRLQRLQDRREAPQRHRALEPSAAIEVTGLRKVYPGGMEAVKGIDFRVEPGEVFGLVGPNGAGKSTTIGMLTTTIAPTTGTARLAGFDIAREPIAARAVSSVVFQEPVVDRALSGRSNLEVHARLWGVDQRTARSRTGELVAALGLAELVDRSAGSYSGGERRRLEIARALVSSPRILFLDEPTVGLDTRIRHELLDVISRFRGPDMTLLLTTHYLEEAQALCDRIAVMHQGEIVALDTPAALLAGLGREIVELRVRGEASRPLSILRVNGTATNDSFAVGSTIIVPVHDGSASSVVVAIRDLGLPAMAVTTRPPTLDDVYLRLTGDRLADAA